MDRNRRIWIYLIFTHRTIWIEIGGYYNFCRYITHSVDIYDFYSWYNFDCLGLVVLLEKYNQRGPSIKKKICGIVSGGGGGSSMLWVVSYKSFSSNSFNPSFSTSQAI